MAQEEAGQRGGARSYTHVTEAAWGLQPHHFSKPNDVNPTVHLSWVFLEMRYS